MKFIIVLASFLAVVAGSTVNFNQKHVAGLELSQMVPGTSKLKSAVLGVGLLMIVSTLASYFFPSEFLQLHLHRAGPDNSVKGHAGKSYEVELRVLVEKFRGIMEVGSEELGTPILDPLQVEKFLLDLEIPDLAKIQIDLTDTVLDGLRDFVIRDISFTLLQLRIDFNVTFPLMKCTAKNYVLAGKIYDDVEIYGEGKAEVGMINLEADTFGSVVIQDGHLFMNKFETVLRMDKFSSNLEGLMGGGTAADIFNEVVEELIPAIVVSEKDKLSTFIGNMVMGFANRHLTQMTLQDFLDLIHGLK